MARSASVKYLLPRPGLDGDKTQLMCLALPARVIALHDDEQATVDLGGVRRKIHTMLIDDVSVGDYVLLHVGFAISKLSPQEAERTLALIDEATTDLTASAVERQKLDPRP